MARPPAARPCGSCPYRRDVPSGIWHVTEYAKLPRYDLPTAQQPFTAFACHQQDGRLCAGWVGCHDTGQLMALRLPLEGLTFEEQCELHDYQTPVPLFSSGTEAAEHGLKNYEEPDEKAERMRRRLRASFKTRK